MWEGQVPAVFFSRAGQKSPLPRVQSPVRPNRAGNLTSTGKIPIGPTAKIAVLLPRRELASPFEIGRKGALAILPKS